ncbi:GMC family oxidoreductase N-terminal domain-containing protein [Nocardia mangyaensis]|uniref:GMC family oxidoreductase N-terminal domain-containing protein n=1 Tax=Nocardia mangyaensis TaxID=2213200 RepID=UPI0026748F9F|nr:GMC family oxidoreductase N-terminal domain-containing protein [Nocardia mangyaensis]MDO3649805.1 GMC family oxidoreductase N-terminal domain-containing protein [Nocardia mangyaensis]
MTSTLIVGAGSAGCVLAARLSADPDHAVRVLEAGPVWPSLADLPAELLDPAHLPVGPESPVVWRYPGNLVRGKLIGGSGAVNGSYFVRPPATDFAAWSAAARSSRWSFDAVLPTFRALEHDLDFGTAPGHGDRGPIPVLRTADPTPFSAEFARACAAAGFPERADLNAPQEPVPWTRAWSPAPDTASSVDPTAASDIDSAPVADAAAGTGSAASTSDHERRRTTRADSAVGHPPSNADRAVVGGQAAAEFGGRPMAACSGAGFGRVPLAMSAGRRAGPAVTHLFPALDRANLTVIGSTMATRLLLRGNRVVGVEWVRGRARGRAYADRVVLCAGAVESAALLIRSGIGPESQLRSLGVPVVLPAPVGAWCTDHPEIGVEFAGPAATTQAVALEYLLEVGDLELRPYTPMFTPGLRRLGVALMRPESTGELTLVSADPAVSPRIDQGYLRSATDRAALRSGVELAAQLIGLRVGQVDDPWLRAHLGTSQHLSGTCRMGPAEDERAVVDELGAVHGIDALTVADLSIVPVPLGRGPQATVVMQASAIAESMAV